MRNEGLVNRVMASLGGSVVILALATGILAIVAVSADENQTMILALELTFVGLLVLATLSIGYVSVVVLYNLFRGAR